MAVTLHLGVHKTATTHLQKSLKLSQPALQDAGVFFAGPDDLRGTELPVIDAINQAGHRDLSLKQRARDRLAEIRARFPQLLLSDENMIGGTNRGGLFRGGQIYPDAAARLRKVIDLLGGGPVRLALSIRDPASYHVSAFALQLARGKELDLQDYMRGRDPAVIGWSALVERLLSVEGVSELILWRYEDYRPLRPRILQALLPEGFAGTITDPPPANVTVTQAGYDWLMARAMEDSDSDLRQLAHDAWKRFPKSAGHSSLRLFEDAVYARSADLYAREIAQLRGFERVSFLTP
ncbi:hypothetical protein [Paracoccus aminophilus]|uniref:Sulfotransferase family protein n=1 Tax=Paracoccus aminophilus JCM 7686 TaxID=1367847 RepID=S5XS34_PARAH|nr:hypothetical protein [Paracoccus aminophilus]AGT10264.1 hypothetical protein JCM7686_3228 [Paracoccus aminophilus JCM 7686]